MEGVVGGVEDADPEHLGVDGVGEELVEGGEVVGGGEEGAADGAGGWGPKRGSGRWVGDDEVEAEGIGAGEVGGGVVEVVGEEGGEEAFCDQGR